jgi:16S rRNA (cytidine1402-2'-O)-methyltransferase
MPRCRIARQEDADTAPSAIRLPAANRKLASRTEAAFGTLYLVSVPIGNPEDITLRARRVLREAALIVAENLAPARALLATYGIATPVRRWRSRDSAEVEQSVLETLCSGLSVAFISDAGTPLVADPGHTLVARALAAGLPVKAVPGAVAAIAGLTVSGFPAGRFVFEGFPPRARADRQAFFAALASEHRAILLYESRTRLRQTLTELLAVLGPSRRVAVACNLTQRQETVFRGSLADALTAFANDPPRGEYTLILSSSPPDSGNPVGMK